MHQGLANIGNTCSINTLIQCIGHCPSLLNHILTAQHPVTKIANRKFSIYEELKDVFKHLWVDNNSIIPRRFINAFYESIGDGYARGEQFDFTEMWMLLLNNLITETHSTENCTSDHQVVREYNDKLLVYLQKKSQESWDNFFKKTNSPLNDLLHGIQIQQIKCKACSKVYHNVEPIAFHYIETVHGTTMASGFNKLLDDEDMDGWKCDKCKEACGYRFIRFWKLPKVWMIVLQRFTDQHKLTNPIDILQYIIIDKEMEMSTNEDTECSKYELKAIANHYGNLHGGHYTAICKNDNGRVCWYEYDDMNVSNIKDIESVLLKNRDAYALFYERMD